MTNYQFAKCLHPRLVKNKYTNDYITVSCGVCKACTLKKHDTMSLKCTIEEKQHKYNMFVTLTFNNDCVPLLQPLYSKRRNGYVFYNLCSRYSPNRLAKQSFFVPDSATHKLNWLKYIQDKVNLNGLIPYVSHVDVKLFLKRLRKNLSKYTNEKIRYYIVSEYGPEHFRPHLHGVFSFNEESTYKYFEKCLKEAWAFKTTKKNIHKKEPFGRVDCSLSRGNCTSYVASYVNSTCTLPRLYQNLPLRPFSSHSCYFAESIYKSEKKEIYQTSPADIIQQGFESNGRYVETTPFSSYIFRYFPRCRDYDGKSYVQLYSSYTIYERCRLYYKENKVSRLARAIFLDLHLTSTFLDPIKEYFYEIFKSPELRKSYKDVDLGNKIIKRIENELYLSKHFLNFVCDYDPRKVYPRLLQIIDFYNVFTQFKLKQFYEQQTNYADTHPDDLDNLILWYDNYDYSKIDDYLTLPKPQYYYYTVKDTPEYSDFLYHTEQRFNKLQKHKKQNDLNKFFQEL